MRSARGVDWIDTAAVYGGGHAERIVGEALAGLPAPRAPAGLHQGRRADRPRLRLDLPRPRPRLPARGVRGLAATAGRRAHRPLPAALAGRRGRGGRGGLGDAGRAAPRGQDPLGGCQQLRLPRCSSAAHRIRPLDSAQLPLSLLEQRAVDERAALAGGPRRAGARLQPAGVGAALRPLLARSPGGAARGRLAAAASALPEPGGRARAASGRAAASDRRASSAPASPSWRSPGCCTSTGSPGRSPAPAAPAQVDGWIGAAALRLEPAALEAIAAARAAAGLEAAG